MEEESVDDNSIRVYVRFRPPRNDISQLKGPAVTASPSRTRFFSPPRHKMSRRFTGGTVNTSSDKEVTLEYDGDARRVFPFDRCEICSEVNAIV
jgi:hypothetical protein